MALDPDTPALLDFYRTILEKDLSRIPDAALDWEATPKAVTIATQLLHIGAVEFVLVGAHASRTPQAADRELWKHLKPGFARQLGTAPASGHDKAFYLDLLGQVRERTRALLSGKRESDPVSHVTFLTSLGMSAEEVTAVRPRFEDPLPALEAGANLIHLLAAHEQYHRGQITLTGFQYKSRK